MISTKTLWLALALVNLPLISSFSSSFQRMAAARANSMRRRHYSSTSTLFHMSTGMPRLESAQIQALETNGYVVVPEFLSADLQQALRTDVFQLRSNDKFNAARVGSTKNTHLLNKELRVTETCVLGNALQDTNTARSYLYQILAFMRRDLEDESSNTNELLDTDGGELLYAYYPAGGFYRKHVDAMPNSPSMQRCYSVLLYLNQNWKTRDAGQLRLYNRSVCALSL